MATIQNIFVRNKLIPKAHSIDLPANKLADTLRQFQNLMPQAHEQVGDSGVEILHDIQLSMSEQMQLLVAYNNADAMNSKKHCLLFEFPNQYLTNLMRLVYPPWYVACFSARHDNPAMWSHYTDNHNGCCLVFNTGRAFENEETARYMSLDGPSGYSWSRDGGSRTTRSCQKLPLDAVRYSTDNHRLEFFSNIGRLTLHDAMKNWFEDEAGTTSELSKHLNSETQKMWRDEYWKNFSPPLLRKLPDWEHEEEYRIVLSDILGLFNADEGRAFTYSYDTLDGIIFGLNVGLSDKLKVMKIVDAKLEMRTVEKDFKFYQARYCSKTGKMKADLLNLLRHVKLDQSKPEKS